MTNGLAEPDDGSRDYSDYNDYSDYAWSSE